MYIQQLLSRQRRVTTVNKKSKEMKIRSSPTGVSHLSRKRRRIDAKFRLWLWRKTARCRFWMSNVRGRRKLQRRLNTKRHSASSTAKTCPRKHKVVALSSCNYNAQTQQVSSVDRDNFKNAQKNELLSTERHGGASHLDTHAGGSGGTSVSCAKTNRKRRKVERHCQEDKKELLERTSVLAKDGPVKGNSLQDQTTSISEEDGKEESLTTKDFSHSAASQSGLKFCERKSPAPSSCDNPQTLQVSSAVIDVIRNVENVPKQVLLSTERHREASHCPLPSKQHVCPLECPSELHTVTPLQRAGADSHTSGTSVPCKKTDRKAQDVERELSERTSAIAKDRPVEGNLVPHQTMSTSKDIEAESLTPTDISRSVASQSGINNMGQSDGKDSSVQFCGHKSRALPSCGNAQTLQVSSADRDVIRDVKNAQKEQLLSTERHGEASHCHVPRKRDGPLKSPTVAPLQGPGAGTLTRVPCKKTDRKAQNVERRCLQDQMELSERTSALGKDGPVRKKSLQDQTSKDSSKKTDHKTGSSPTQKQTGISNEVLKKDIQEFLDVFYRMYGSFFALQRKDILRHLKRKFSMDFNERKSWVLSEAETYQAAVVRRPVPSFQVVYKKHMLTLEDLSSLENDNWLNDQVINMYGELIMESSHHKVHFFNSFFHRQLITKGYEGVRRWTKQVDLFSKQLLLVPVHLDVHWCLVAVDTAEKSLQLYDSQDIVLKIVAQDIMNYLRIEAKERQQTKFQKDWIVSVKKGIPQQTNENDCGVFVLEYCRCLASGKPLDFSQEHIPRVRQRIYKELCDCKIQQY